MAYTLKPPCGGIPTGFGIGSSGEKIFYDGDIAASTLTEDFDWSISEATIGSGGSGGVPEPSTWALVAAGFGVVGMGLRHRRRLAIRAA